MFMTNGYMKVVGRVFFIGFLTISLFSCSLEDSKPGITIFSETFDFREELYGFTAGFSDFPAGKDDSTLYELRFAYTQEPEGNFAIMISGNNHSDDLFMFLKKRLSGLKPSTDYTITYNVEFYSNARANVSGIAPGEGVYLKVGATDLEPKSVIDKGKFIMNIDKGNEDKDGADMVNIGDVSVPDDTNGYIKTYRSNASSIDKPLKVRTNNEGDLWLIVGTDSAIEGVTTLFYSSISVVLSSSN